MSNIGKKDLIFRMHITSLSQARNGSHLLVRGIHPKYKIIAPNIGDFYDHTLHLVIHKQKVVSQSSNVNPTFLWGRSHMHPKYKIIAPNIGDFLWSYLAPSYTQTKSCITISLEAHASFKCVQTTECEYRVNPSSELTPLRVSTQGTLHYEKMIGL